MKKQKLFILIVFSISIAFFTLNCSAYTNSDNKTDNKIVNPMKIIYENKLDSLTLRFERTSDSIKYIWHTSLTNIKTNKTIILQSDTIVKNMAWEHGEKIGENPADLYTIIGSFLDRKTLYVMYDKLGTVSIYKYTFTDSDIFKTENKELLNHFVTPAYGNLTSEANFKRIDGKIYILLNVGQGFKKEKISELYSIEEFRFVLWKLKFIPKAIVTVATLSPDTKDWISNISLYGDLSEESKTKYERLKPYLEKPYYKALSLNIEARVNEKNELKHQGLFPYSPYNYNLDQGFGKDKIIKSLEELFLFYKPNVNIKYIDYISNKDNKEIFFFLQEEHDKKEIIKYISQEFIWILSDYVEVEKTDKMTP